MENGVYAVMIILIAFLILMENANHGLLVLIALLILIIIYLYYTRGGNSDNDKIIQKLSRQAARWSVAAEQDENPMIAVLHANYGAGYLWALKDVATTTEIERVIGTTFQKFEEKIVAVQDKVVKNLARVCPEYAPDSSVLTRIAGEGE